MEKDLNKPATEASFFRKKLFLSIIIPGILVSIMWLVKIVETLFETDFSGFGIFPLSYKGIPGIFLSPFIHHDYTHLINNSLPFFLLLVALFYFYSEIALKVLAGIYLITGLLVWLAGREGWHIGASGLVYGLASFLFFSGIIRKYYRLTALSLLIVFLYGSMVWGLFPGVYNDVSWESHMLGFVSGIVLSVFYRKQGPQQPEYDWMKAEDAGNDEEINAEELNEE
jgi:membrane associated rhomboid family serine protease